MDKDLIQAVINKKKWAFSIFYNEMVDHFYNFLKSSYDLSNEEINDIIAETFIKIWKNLDNYSKNPWNFIAWTWTILKNTTKDYFKLKKDIAFSEIKSQNNEDFNFEDNLADNQNIEEFLDQDYQINTIKKALKQLKPEEKEIIVLKFSEWKSLEEIAQILWISYANVRVKLHRSLKKLKKYLTMYQ